MTMAAMVGQWRATYARGKSLILAGPTSLVLLKEPTAEHERLINALWDQVLRSATMSELAARLAVFSVDKLPGFAAMFWTPDGMRSLIRGDVIITDPSSGSVIANGSDIQTWSESGLGNLTRVSVLTGEDSGTGPVLPLVVGVAYASWVSLDASTEAQVTSPQASEEEIEHVQPVTLAAMPMSPAASPSISSEDPWGSDDGSPDTEPMPAIDDGGEQRVEETRQASWSEQSVEPRSVESAEDDMLQADTQLMDALVERRSFDPSDGQLFAPQHPAAAQAAISAPVSPDVDTAATLPSSAPVPSTPAPNGSSTESLILAADCTHGHSNPPAATNCRICGAPIPPQGPRLVRRPVLCVLRASDGTTADVDRAVLVGRAPDPDRSKVKAPRLMSLQSPGHDISRTHVEVAPEGWQVVATDLKSTNGTVLIRPGGYERQQLAPGEHVPVQPGSVLELGDGVSITVALPT
jgi:hypothetical protein